MKLSAFLPSPELVRQGLTHDSSGGRAVNRPRTSLKRYARLLTLLLLLLACTAVVWAQETVTPLLTTDKPDYKPGETATFTGSGFLPGETVTIQVLHADGDPDDGPGHDPWTVTADENGGFVTTWLVCEDCLGEELLAIADGQTSARHAEAYFTDALIPINANTLWSSLSPQPTSLDDILIRNGATLTVDVPNAVCRTIRIGNNSSPTATAGNGTLTFTSGSQVTASLGIQVGDPGSPPTVPARSGTLNMVAGATLIAGDGTSALLAVANTSSSVNISGGSITIYGRFEIADGNTATITGGAIKVDPAVIGGANHVVRFAAGANVTFTSGTLTIVDPNPNTGGGDALRVDAGTGTKNFAGSTIGFGDGVSTNSGSTEGFDLNAATGITLGNIVVNNPSGTNRHVRLRNHTVLGGSLTITAGSLTVDASGALNDEFDITLAGNWSNSGTFVQDSRKVTFNGAAQSIGGTTATTFYNLDIDGTADKVLTNDITITNTLTLLNRNIDAYTNSKTVYAKGSVVRNTTGHIKGNLKKDVTTTNVYVFEVGQTLYAPLDIKFSTLTTGGTLTVRTVDGDHPSIGTSTLDPNNSINRYWTVVNGGIVFGSCSVTFHYNLADNDAGTTPATFKVGKLDGSTWTYPSIIGTPTTIEIRAGGLNGFSDLIVASCPAPIISNQPDNVVACLGASAVFTVASNAVGTKAYQWFKEAGTTDTELDDEDDGGDIQITNNGATLTINNLALGDAGSYYVVVRQDCGSTTTSDVVTLGVDNTAPVIPDIFVSKSSLWPPNHKMVDIELSASDGTGTGIASATVSVTSNEPIDDLGDGSTDPDMAWTGGVQTNTSPYTVAGPVTANQNGKFIIQLRAERSGVKALDPNDPGRTYTVTFTATDACGYSTTKTTTVTVAHNITAPTTGSSFKIGTVVGLAGTFWDIPGNRHTAKWQLDGTTITGVVAAEPSGTKLGKVTGSYKPTAAGVYKLRMNVTDQKGITSYATTNGDHEAFLVAYDPRGGYTYGAGKFISPKGAWTGNPNASGKVSFGFTSNYFKGATNPKGETAFEFKLAGFEFYALNFDYLVISGAKAQYKGLGKTVIDGVEQSGLAFIMTVIDGQLSGGGGVDKIRMKIYNKNTGAVIYDNQPGAGDNADPVMAVTEPKTNGTDIVVVNTTATTTVTSADVNTPEQTGVGTEPNNFSIKARLNPTDRFFTVTVFSPAAEPVDLRVFDIHGKQVYRTRGAVQKDIRFGETLPRGTYIAEAVQGSNRSLLKLIKQ